MKNWSPLVTAHTGCMKTPPNSVESALKGMQAGADIIEVDVNATKDGVAVLFHDSHVRIASHRSVNICDLTFDELQKLERNLSPESISPKTKITRLEDVLDLGQHFRKSLNLDIKSYTCLEPMAEAVKFRNMVDDVIISGCHKDYAVYVKKNYPEFQVLLNADPYISPLDDFAYEHYTKTTCRDAIAASCCGININYKNCREEMLYYTQLRCLPVQIYTVDTFPEMEKFLTLGVHSITTNEVESLIALKDQTRTRGGAQVWAARSTLEKQETATY